MEDVASPCVNVCEIDPSRGLCRGCLRSLQEIALWSELSPAQKRTVLTRIASRRATASITADPT